MTDNKVWHNLFKKRLYVSTYGECVMTVQSCMSNAETLSDAEMQSMEFYVVKPSDALEYTIYYGDKREFTADAWTFSALAHKMTAVSDIVAKSSFDEEHILCSKNFVAAVDKRVKARFDFVKTMEEYGVDVATYVNDLMMGLLSYGSCRGVYTEELVKSGGISPLEPDVVEIFDLRNKLHKFAHKSMLNFSARATYKVLNLNNCTIYEYKSNSLYNLINTINGDADEFLLYGGLANYVWLDVDRTLPLEC